MTERLQESGQFLECSGNKRQNHLSGTKVRHGLNQMAAIIFMATRWSSSQPEKQAEAQVRQRGSFCPGGAGELQKGCEQGTGRGRPEHPLPLPNPELGLPHEAGL